jgi:hypothetical protein
LRAALCATCLVTPCIVAEFAGVAAAQTVISPRDAMAHLGESVTVEGRVDAVACSPMACLISFQTNYSGLIASIPGPAIAKFPSVKETYSGRNVRVRGQVSEKNGRPRIELVDPGAIEVVSPGTARVASSGPPPAPPGGASTDRTAQVGAGVPAPGPTVPASGTGAGGGRTDVASAPAAGRPIAGSAPAGGSVAAQAGAEPVTLRPRVEITPDGAAARADSTPAQASQSDELVQEIRALRDQVSGLSDQLADLDARLANVEQIEEQQVAANAPAQPNIPGPPSYVVSGQRPLSLSRINKGWTADRVLRAMGEPTGVTGGVTGVTTWYYSGGRAVTLDANGRVVSTAGF